MDLLGGSTGDTAPSVGPAAPSGRVDVVQICLSCDYHDNFYLFYILMKL